MTLSHVDSPRPGAPDAAARAPLDTCRQRSSPAARSSRAAFLVACVCLALAGCAAHQTNTAFRAQSPFPLPAVQPIPRELATQALSLADKPALTAADFIDQPLADVRVEGNTTIPEIAILHEVQSKPGRKITPSLVNEDAANLVAKNWFFRVTPTFRVTDDGPVLIFQVVEKPILAGVDFVGNEKIKDPVLESLTGLKPGAGFDVAANKEAALRIKEYYREKGYYFAEVKLAKGDHPDHRDVVFEIHEGKKVRVHKVRFDGNREIASRVLRTKLATKTVMGIPGTFLVIGGSYDPETIKNDADALVRYYHALGYFDAKVEAEEELRKDQSEVHVHFRVAEGQRYKVRDIELAGNHVLSTDQLRDEPELRVNEYYNERFLRKDVQAMRDKYDDLGRLFAKVEPVPRFLEEPGYVDLVYQIDEDMPRRFGSINIHIQGDHPHSTETLIRNQINRWVQPGQLARMRDIQGAQTTLRGSGYWDSKQSPPTVNVEPVEGLEYLAPPLLARGQDEFTRVAPAFRPDENPFAEFEGSVTTARLPDDTAANDEPVGRARIGRSALSTELPDSESQPASSWWPSYNIDPGAIFQDAGDDDVVVRGQSIDRHGQPMPYDPLQTVSPQGDPFGDALRNPATPGFVDVDIDVTEARTGRLMFGVGVNSDAGVVGSVVLQEDNFDILRPPTSWADIVNGEAWRGRGQSFRLELVPGTQVSRYLINWQNPYFMNTDFSLGLSGFFYNRYFDDWTEDRAGGRISIGRLLSRHWSGNVAVRLENVDIRDFRTPAPALVTDVEGDNFLSTAQFTLTYDTRDSPFLPSQGHMVEGSFEQGFGEFNYPRVDLQGVQYFTVYERPDGFGKHILQFRGQATWTGEDTPLFERLYAGGYSSFRGFEFRGVTPRQMGFEVGGEFMTLGTVEYMVPLTADDNIRAVVFSDFGTVDEDVSFDRFRATAGFGFRLAIPAMGPAPIAIDFAWPIVQEQFDEDRVFSFYVGFTR